MLFPKVVSTTLSDKVIVTLSSLKNSFAQPIGIEEAYKLSWVEFKKLLIKKYYHQTEIQKMDDEFYHLTVKGNDLNTYVRRFQELATLCPTMVSELDYEKMMEAFIGGLLLFPRFGSTTLNDKVIVTLSSLKSSPKLDASSLIKFLESYALSREDASISSLSWTICYVMYLQNQVIRHL
nr:reverse transcriptase domain-containing protein [Tanacetum cinerariifolium]